MEPIVSLDQLDPDKLYTYADYLTWQFQERVELIKGRIMKMAAPAPKHQDIVVNFLLQVKPCLSRRGCRVGLSPFDVRLPKPKGNKAYTVVQPDLFVICNPALIDDKGCDGVPDFIIEVVSPSTKTMDTQTKFELYAEVGVKEYWIVFPENRIVEQFVLKPDNQYRLIDTYLETETLSCRLFPELVIELKTIFEN